MKLEMNALDELQTISVGTLVYVLSGMGITRCFMRDVKALTPGDRLFGRARTLRTAPTREDVARARRAKPKSEDPHRIAMEDISKGEILVIGAGGQRNTAVLGDILAQRIKTAGGAGVVTDGCIRDVTAMSEVGLPIFAGGVHAGLFSNELLAMDINIPIDCGGVLVCAGDYIVADQEGVAVVPALLAAEVAERSIEQEQLDGFVRSKVAEGVPLSQAYPPNEAILAEYARARGK